MRPRHCRTVPPGQTGAASFVGAVGLFAAITALVSASEFALAVLVGATVVLWVLATLRHAWTPREAGRAAGARPAAAGR